MGEKERLEYVLVLDARIGRRFAKTSPETRVGHKLDLALSI